MSRVGMLALVAVVIGGPARAASLDCLDAPTLEALITCVKDGMPRKSQGYVVPTPAEQADWSGVAWAMLNGSCDNIILPASLARSYSIAKVLDRDVWREYCALVETRDEDGDGRVDRGWGTLITDPRPLREIIVLAPHPLADARTHLQGVEVFKGVRARAVLVAGTHRAASERGGTGACGTSRASDPTHSVDTMFQPTLSEAMELYGQLGRDYVVLQFHGMKETSCAGVDVHLSNGSPDSVDGKVHELRQALQTLQPEWTVTTAEAATDCPLDGVRNVQVRLLAGVPYEDLCDTTPMPGSPRFVHIEQKRDVRRNAEVWVRAVRGTWPRAGAPVARPGIPDGATSPAVVDAQEPAAPGAILESAPDAAVPATTDALDAGPGAPPPGGETASTLTRPSDTGGEAVVEPGAVEGDDVTAPREAVAEPVPAAEATREPAEVAPPVPLGVLGSPTPLP